jgi:hypothetical protein
MATSNSWGLLATISMTLLRRASCSVMEAASVTAFTTQSLLRPRCSAMVLA